MTSTTKIDAVLHNAIGNIPGVVALATTGAGTIYEGAFGTSDLTTNAPMTLDTVFGLASMTKPLVSAGAMKLVEQGKLTLDAPIANVLPELASPKVLTGFDPDGTPRLRPAIGPITLRHLLSHSSGYGYNTWNANILRWMEHTNAPRMPANSAELAQVPLLFDPGTQWTYGISTDVAGLAVEAASGQRLDHYLRDALFTPLGMTDTTAELTDAQRARQVRVHHREADGSLTPATTRQFGNPVGWCIGGGALLGTGRDYLRFVRMILNQGSLDGTRVLSPTTVAEMSRNSLRPGVHVTKMHSVIPARSNDAEFFPGQRKTWSTAFMINEEKAPTGRNPGSLAWAGIANTYFWIDPAANLGGVILMQVMPFVDHHALATFTAFERAVYEAVGAPG